MEYEINARISNRHVHLTKEVYDKLFDEEMHIKNKLNQIGEFSSDKTLKVKNGDKIIENVRIVGPLRKYNQVELSKRDARFLNIDAPVRKSGELNDTPSITLITDKGSVVVSGVIIANRHVHVNEEMAKKYGVKDNQKVKILVKGDKGGEMDAFIKVTENGYYELHIDTDDANAFLINDNDKLTMII